MMKRFGAAIAETYRLGGRTLVAAPLIVALVVVPEAAQHVAEIKLGMFESREAFRSMADHPTRWAFGYAKVAGVVATMLFTARFWATGSVRKALLMPPNDLPRLVFAIALTFAAGLPFEWAQAQGPGLPMVASVALHVISAIIQAGLVVFVMAALLGDRTVTLRAAFSRRWPTAIVITLLFAIAFVPAQALHMANHALAIGRPEPLVWAVIAFDSLLVGLLSALMGTALYVGFTSGARWPGSKNDRDHDQDKDQRADADADVAAHGILPAS